MTDLDQRLASVEAALGDADVVLTTGLGGFEQPTRLRAWHGQVLVDWEPDDEVGDCLLRPALLRRLIALHAQIELEARAVRITAPGRIVAGVSAQHGALVKKLGGAKRLELQLVLDFDNETFTGGTETYLLIERRQPRPLLRLEARVSARGALPRTSPAPR